MKMLIAASFVSFTARRPYRESFLHEWLKWKQVVCPAWQLAFFAFWAFWAFRAFRAFWAFRALLAFLASDFLFLLCLLP